MINLRMRAALLCLLLTGIYILGTGCNAFTLTQRGAAIGAGAGATVGGFIGKFAGNPALGSIIGGAVGGTAGAFIGRNIDKQPTDINKLDVEGATLIPQGEGMQVKFNTGILFNPGKADLDSIAKTNLLRLAASLRNCPQANVIITGHTDDREAEAPNDIMLSLNRADSVKVYLASTGLDTARLIAQGKGIVKLLTANNNDEGRSQNRSVDIMLVPNQQASSQASLGQKKN